MLKKPLLKKINLLNVNHKSDLLYFFIFILFSLVISIDRVQAEDFASIYEQALNRDPEYKSQQAAFEATLESRPQALAQWRKPTLSLSGNLDRNYQDIENPTGYGRDGDVQYTAYGYSLDLRQPIYHKDRAVQVEKVDALIMQAELELVAAKQDLIIRMAERYFSVLATEDNLWFSQAEAAALERQLEQAKERLIAGLAAITDVHEAQAGYDLARANVLQAENQIEDAREALREMTGATPTLIASLGDELPLVSPSPEVIEQWVDKAMSNNPQVKAQLVATEAAEYDIEQANAGHHPTLDLVASHGFRSTGGQFGNTDTDFTQIGLQLNIPIYEGGQVNSRSRQFLHRHVESLERLEQARRAAERSTRDAYLGIHSSIRQVEAYQQAVRSSEVAVEATQMGYTVGTRTVVDVVNAEQELLRAKRNYAQAKYDYLLNTLKLKQAAGSLSGKDVENINQWLVMREK